MNNLVFICRRRCYSWFCLCFLALWEQADLLVSGLERWDRLCLTLDVERRAAISQEASLRADMPFRTRFF